VSTPIDYSPFCTHRERVGVKNVIGSSMDKLLQKYKYFVSEIARQLERDGLVKKLHKMDHIFLCDILNQKLDDSKWPTVLFRLTRLLHTLHKKGVVILVDEYDTPTSHAVQHGYFPEVCPCSLWALYTSSCHSLGQ
jgi:hypothetical protein